MKWAVVFLLSILSHKSFNQDVPRKDINLEKLADEIFPIQDEDLNYSELYENLAQLLSNPLDLNTITREQLRSLFVVKEDNINSFLNYRDENGPLLSIYELQSIPGWDRRSFDLVIPFVTVYESQTKFNSSIFSRIAAENNNYLLLRYERTLETKKGYRSSTDSSQRYAGSPDKMYLRYRVARSNDFSIGVTAEKDAGEALTWAPSQKQFGFDFLSFHGQLQNKGRVKNLIVGDFQSQFGQGLILGSVFGFGKNAETVTTVRRSNLGFLPYTSLNENTFFRGAAVSYDLSRSFSLHGFISHLFKDGGIDNSVDENSVITAFATSGLHRTPGEIQSRKQVGETSEGAVLQFRTQNIDAGLIFHDIRFSLPVVRTPLPYNQFAFRGSENQNSGVYVNYSWASFTCFSEFAQTIYHGNAVTAGLLGNITHQLEVSLLYRNFAKDFYSFYSNAFSENTTPQNEQGFYGGWKYIATKKYSASGYLDLFRFPWLRYRSYEPSDGSEWLLRFNYTPSKNVSAFLQAREESKFRNLSDEANLYRNSNGVKRNYWINCDYGGLNLRLKTRAQFSDFTLGGKTTRGVALVQDVSFSLKRWSFALRYALFDTDDYDNRLYIYERDVWLAYSFPAYYGAGVKNYVLIQYKLSEKIDLWFRWSRIRYTDRVVIGSDGETIAGNSGNDIKFQARISF